MQAILLTSSLLLVALMLGCLGWLAGTRPHGQAEAIAVDAADEPA
jgi:hypothetical protein